MISIQEIDQLHQFEQGFAFPQGLNGNFINTSLEFGVDRNTFLIEKQDPENKLDGILCEKGMVSTMFAIDITDTLSLCPHWHYRVPLLVITDITGYTCMSLLQHIPKGPYYRVYL